MASYAFTTTGNPSGVSKTLTGTTADTVTVTSPGSFRIVILNRGAGTIYARADGTAAVSEADGTIPIPAGTSIEYASGPGVTALSIVGNSDAYSVLGLAQGAWT